MRTPYDAPHTLWERLTFPALREAYAEGRADARDANRSDADLDMMAPGQADEVRRMAVYLAQLGIRLDEVEPMARLWFTEPARTLYDLTMLAEKIKARYGKDTR